jgi:long-chain acyl-CoA synthetase
LGLHGLERALDRTLLRRVLLRRAGLDRCAQLIVGSAPASPELLGRLGDLGVEVHDAYGLTEAPLVALNRRGRNRIGTVGEPLPETSVRVAADGEVLVRGPQVTPGYVDAGMDQPFRDGWLATGDLGHLTADGYLVIDGRKKELLKTAYGKYLHPAKVEAMLRALPVWPRRWWWARAGRTVPPWCGRSSPAAPRRPGWRRPWPRSTPA